MIGARYGEVGESFVSVLPIIDDLNDAIELSFLASCYLMVVWGEEQHVLSAVSK